MCIYFLCLAQTRKREEDDEPPSRLPPRIDNEARIQEVARTCRVEVHLRETLRRGRVRSVSQSQQGEGHIPRAEANRGSPIAGGLAVRLGVGGDADPGQRRFGRVDGVVRV
eukprot:817533-Prorocentrum_minimum.AAC.2